MERDDFVYEMREYLSAQVTYMTKVSLQAKLWAGLVGDIYWPRGAAQVRERIKDELLKN